MKLSVIIPSYKDPLLHKTIDSILTNSSLGKELEIIIVLDGYWPVTPVKDDSRIKQIHLSKNRGMRGAINAGVSIARGEYLMRTDEHCMFAEGFDKMITDNMKEHWIVTPVRYFLDPVKWEVMDKKPVVYEKLIIQEGRKFAGQPWRSREKERAHKTIDETMAMQGSCWFMAHSWWDKVIKELQTEGYGPLYQDSHEMQFKTWQAGGKLVVNKATWFAHKHVSFPRTHQDGTKENPANRNGSFDYALKIWKDYYEEVVKPKWKL